MSLLVSYHSFDNEVNLHDCELRNKGASSSLFEENSGEVTDHKKSIRVGRYNIGSVGRQETVIFFLA